MVMGNRTRCPRCGQAHTSCVMGSICGACYGRELITKLKEEVMSIPGVEEEPDGEAPLKANDHMVGGNHYRLILGEQHWDRAWRLYGSGPFQYQITKYVERYKDKCGIQDLEKARHFIDKLIELETKALKEKLDECKRSQDSAT